MAYSDNSFISTTGVYFLGVINDIKKSGTALQPIYEGFTNALEAIKIRKQNETFVGKITINIEAVQTTTAATEFRSLSIIDNGIGFNDAEFERFNTLKDYRKGYHNLGSGRIQFLHFFNRTVFHSVFKEGGRYFEREFIMSQEEEFLKESAIVYHRYKREISQVVVETKVTFSEILERSNVYDELNHLTLKEALIERYIHYFCYNRDTPPTISIKFFVQSNLKGETEISSDEIPKEDNTRSFDMPYDRLAAGGNGIGITSNTESFTIDAFKISKDLLDENRLRLVSKGEIVEESNIVLENLSETESIAGKRFLFLVSSPYIDNRDTNVRGRLKIPKKDVFLKSVNLFTPSEILIEDIQARVNREIEDLYPEIAETKRAHEEQFEKLKDMFLLSDETARQVEFSVTDNAAKILEKYYEMESRKTAMLDAKIKESIDRLDNLNTKSETYHEDLEREVKKLVKAFPQQNKTSLTHYVARRKLVLELFDKILESQLLIQKSGRNIDENLLHNLIFQQANTSPDTSDLWLINEDFVYFRGASQMKLKSVTINGIPLLRKNLTAEEEEYRTSLKEDRYSKTPDILLFPDEGKCIIIEFKNPEVNVAGHLTQITNYAALIRNFSDRTLPFYTFYGFLIGEQINPLEVQFHDYDFIEAYHFDYLYRPSKKILGVFSADKKEGNLYTEVIKYSTLLKRAKRRNQIFIKKLTGDDHFA